MHESLVSASTPTSGVVTAQQCGTDKVDVLLSSEPVVRLSGLSDAELAAVLKSLNKHGRLGVTSDRSEDVQEGLLNIEVVLGERKDAGVSKYLSEQLEVLIPLVARWGIPGGEWLVAADEFFPADPAETTGGSLGRYTVEANVVESASVDPNKVEVVEATGEWKERRGWSPWK